MRIKFILFLLLFFCFTIFLNGQNNIDSLKNIIQKQTDTTLFNSLLKLGDLYYEKGQLDSSIKFYAIGENKTLTKKSEKFNCQFLIKLGTMNREKGIYNVSSQYLYKALTLSEKNNFVSLKAKCYNGIAIISAIQKDYEKAIETYNKSLKIYKETNNDRGLASIYNNLGLIYLDKKENSTALKYFFKALNINLQNSEDYQIATNSENIGLTYSNLENHDLGNIYFAKALKIWYMQGDYNSISINLGYIGNTLILQKKYQSAIDTLQKGLIYAKQANSQASIRDITSYFSKAYEGLNDFKNSLYYYKISKQLKDSLQNGEKLQEITEIQLNYDFNKIKLQDSIKHQVEVSLKEKQLSTEKNYNYIISSILLVILVLLFFVYKNYKEKNKAHNVIKQQKEIVESKQKEILDSISYAKKIQDALLFQANVLNKISPNNFVLFNPKDIVSGDFYWATLHNSNFYLAVCDSTGHGVPGAFMSLLNIGFLNEAIKEKEIVEPHSILNYVRDRLIDTISNDGQKDGFDGILICINQTTKKITYSASNNSPVLISDSNLIELPKDRMPVGKGENLVSFNLYNLPYKENDMLFLSTDGYADQFGGPNGKKFKKKQLNQLLLSNSKLPLEKQKEELHKNFKTWQGHLDQVDDICIIGLKL